MSCNGTFDPPPAKASRQLASCWLMRSARLKASSDWRATPLKKYSILLRVQECAPVFLPRVRDRRGHQPKVDGVPVRADEELVGAVVHVVEEVWFPWPDHPEGLGGTAGRGVRTNSFPCLRREGIGAKS
jgi:hypothetical protein